MGKDFFGADRFHCTSPGCFCTEYYSKAQQDLAEAEANQEEEGNAIEVLESKYSRMTCQAKSEYQLTCFNCDHNVSLHATKKRDVIIEQGRPATLYVLQGVCFRKSGAEPDKAGVVRTKRVTGTPLRTTGRNWRGPSGGLWVELEVAAEQKPGWVLVEGPGFGVDGPILGEEPPSEQAEAEAEAAAPPAPLPPPAPLAVTGPPPPAQAALTTAQALAAAAARVAEGPPGKLGPEKARAALERISQACSRPAFAKRAEDPLQVGELFIEACARPAADFGFGMGEEGVRRLFAALRPHAEDATVRAKLASIEESLHLEPGNVMALAESM